MSIIVQHLTRRFGPICALDGVSFEVNRGELVGLIGPNGAGKTTLLRILATLCAPDGGTARIAGFDSSAQAVDVRRRVGYVPENPPLIGEARVDEYLSYRAALHDVARPGRAKAVERVIELCQLGAVRRRLARNLSHGFRRRLSLAEALIHDPLVLLLDEPTVGLDPVQIGQTRSMLSALAAERAILISTHLLADAEILCQRALVLLRGRLADDLTIKGGSEFGCEAELFGPIAAVRCWAEQRSSVVSFVELADGWCRVTFPEDSHDQREEIAAHSMQQGWKLRELRRTTASLEERFVRLTLQSRAA